MRCDKISHVHPKDSKTVRILLNTKPMVLPIRTGIGYYVSNLYRELGKAGVEVTPTRGEAARSAMDILGRVSSGLKESLGIRRSRILTFFGDALTRLVLRKSTSDAFDLYHETTLDPFPEIKSRSVCNLFDLSFLRFPGHFPGDLAEAATRNVTKSVSLAERIIVNTSFIRDEAVSLLKLPPEKIDIIPLAASLSCDGPAAPGQRPGEVRRFTDKDYILFVGTVDPRKNLKTLVRAFREVREHHDLSLVICGAFGALSDDIVSFPEELNIGKDVIFTNYVDESTLLHLYRSASLLVYPSFYEGFGIPPLDAMSCNVPVIVSDIPPLREVCGDAALSFSPEDHEELALRIRTILTSDSLRSEMVLKGAQRVGRYSWQRVAEETVRTYRKALAQ